MRMYYTAYFHTNQYQHLVDGFYIESELTQGYTEMKSEVRKYYNIHLF